MWPPHLAGGAGRAPAAAEVGGALRPKPPPPTGYEPLYVLKPVAPEVWLADGEAISFYGLPFPTRMTVVRLGDGALWVHSPISPDPGLLAQVRALGPVRHLVAPNWIHYAFVAPWQQAFPESVAWAAPGVRERAAQYGSTARWDRELGDAPEAPWADELDQVRVDGSRLHVEVVFFHRASRTAVLTDLIENFEASKISICHRPLAWLAGTLDPDGKAPLDMRWSFRGGEGPARAALARVLAWEPERVVVAHGRWYDRGGSAELRRAFAWLLEPAGSGA